MMNCPICLSAAGESFQGKYCRVLKCSNSMCGHLYAADAAPDHGVQEHPDPERERAQYWERNQRLTAYWERRGFIGRSSRVLDFGAGSGHISLAIQEFLGISDVVCLEADPSSQVWLKKSGLRVVDNLNECRSDFDAVLLVELIEHITAPVDLLKNIKSHMSSSGKLFISTPCGETRSGSRRTNAYDTPEHVHFFTELSLKKALMLAGFKNIRFEFVTAMYPKGDGAFRGIIFGLKSIFWRVRDFISGRRHLIALCD